MITEEKIKSYKTKEELKISLEEELKKVLEVFVDREMTFYQMKNIEHVANEWAYSYDRMHDLKFKAYIYFVEKVICRLCH
jgi:hypothetical protein